MIEPGAVSQNRYRAGTRAGQGGMGAVFLAWDERPGSKVRPDAAAEAQAAPADSTDGQAEGTQPTSDGETQSAAADADDPNATAKQPPNDNAAQQNPAQPPAQANAAGASAAGSGTAPATAGGGVEEFSASSSDIGAPSGGGGPRRF